jgi:hypothetical protein
MNPHEKPSVGVEVSLSLKAVHENREHWLDGRVAKILQSGPAPRLVAKRVTFEQPELSADIVA